MTDPIPSILTTLTAERDRLQVLYDQLEDTAEKARRACVPFQQRLEKIKDAIRKLEEGQEWKTEGGES